MSELYGKSYLDERQKIEETFKGYSATAGKIYKEAYEEMSCDESEKDAWAVHKAGYQEIERDEQIAEEIVDRNHRDMIDHYNKSARAMLYSILEGQFRRFSELLRQIGAHLSQFCRLKLFSDLVKKKVLVMAYIMVDVESDGPIPGDYSMICFGAVIVDENLNQTFYGKLKPISDSYIPEALAVSGFTREDTLLFDSPFHVMTEFAEWVAAKTKSKPIFISDNNGYDWMFICWYFHHFLNSNPFGYSSQNLGSFYKGIIKDTSKNFKHLRKTRHSHNPVDDAVGNAEAFLAIIKEHKIKISL